MIDMLEDMLYVLAPLVLIVGLILHATFCANFGGDGGTFGKSASA